MHHLWIGLISTVYVILVYIVLEKVYNTFYITHGLNTTLQVHGNLT